MRRFVIGVALVVVVGAGACHLLPERYAVNAPLGHLLLDRGIASPAAGVVDERLRVPAGFAISIWADDLPGARFLRFTPTGDLLVTRPAKDRVTLLHRDADGDGRSDGATSLLDESRERPTGIDLHDGWLYVAWRKGILRVPFDAEARALAGPEETIVEGLPRKGHWTRIVRIGPDERLYLAIGSSCNVCIEEDPRRAAIVRYDLDGSGEELFATGLRNSVGFDWQPGTGQLYATDNGRDLLGDDFPPCELNRIEAGGFYGWPFAHGDRVPDPDLGAGHEREIAESRPPAHRFRAHNAPLGITFVRGDALPEPWRSAAFVALHGSWNRSEKDGYKVVSLHWTEAGIEERDFVTGFLRDEDVIGRPVDVAEGPDGALYVSDDYAGVIYRVAWVGGAELAAGGPAGDPPPEEAP